METTERQSKLAIALVEAQKKTRALAKDAENRHHRYYYTSSEYMIEACRATLSQCGLSLSLEEWTFEPGEAKGVGGKDAIGRVQLTYCLLHTSGESRPIRTSTFVCPEKGRPPDKAEFAAMTENLAYTLRSVLLVPRNDDLAEDISGRDDSDYEPRRSDPTPPRQSEPRRLDEVLDGDDIPDSSGDQLADEFIQEIRRLGELEPSQEVLAKLERLPPEIKGLNFARPTYLRIVKIYNPIMKDVREALGVPA